MLNVLFCIHEANSGVELIPQGAEKILGMNESGELQDLLTKIEVGFSEDDDVATEKVLNRDVRAFLPTDIVSWY